MSGIIKLFQLHTEVVRTRPFLLGTGNRTRSHEKQVANDFPPAVQAAARARQDGAGTMLAIGQSDVRTVQCSAATYNMYVVTIGKISMQWGLVSVCLVKSARPRSSARSSREVF